MPCPVVDLSERRRLDYVVQHQQLDTGAESLDVEIFHIPGEGKFAAFANAATVTGSPSTFGYLQVGGGQVPDLPEAGDQVRPVLGVL